MEEILSSIKRIIAEEGEGAVATRTRRPARSAPVAAPLDDHDEVLELSDPVPPRQPEARPAPQPQVQYEPQPEVRPEPVVSRAPERVAAPEPDMPTAAEPVSPPADPIVSPRAAEASRGSLEALSRLIVKPDAPGADTLEGLVREMLRPMLREWLDANLPRVVETMVAKEIARITDRGL